MADITVPRTPSPVAAISKTGFTSLTPPPTTQAQRYGSFSAQAKPPRSMQRNTRVPTLEEAHSYSASECRELLLELLPLLGETRMALAHTQLQLNLLNIEASEAAQRAEVEHEMTRREADVLRASSPIIRGRAATVHDNKSPLAQIQRQLEVALEAGRDLEADNFALKNRLHQAKRIIKHLNSQKIQLADDNHLLRERIKQNRAHIEAERSANPSPAIAVYTSPSRIRHPRPVRPSSPLSASAPTTQGHTQNPLDALLMADQILSGDPSSMPTTPRPHTQQLSRARQGHTRGAQSLSSLPSTPVKHRRSSATELPLPSPTGLPATPRDRIVYSARADAGSWTAPAAAKHSRTQGLTKPGSGAGRNNQSQTRRQSIRHDEREDTISPAASDRMSGGISDEALTDEDIPISASQASHVASGMLRKNPTGTATGSGSGSGSGGGAKPTDENTSTNPATATNADVGMQYPWMRPAAPTSASASASASAAGSAPTATGNDGLGMSSHETGREMEEHRPRKRTKTNTTDQNVGDGVDGLGIRAWVSPQR